MDETLKKSIAASIGAVLTSFVVTPLEVVKTRLQVQVPNVVQVPPAVQKCSHYNFSNGLMDTMLPKETLLKKCKCSAAQLSCTPKPNSVLYTMARIVRLEGPLALYAGLPPTLLFAVPSTALYFTSYEKILSECKELFPSVSHGALAMVSGGIARAGAASIFSPLELIRVQMQSGESNHSFLTHARQIANGGVRQLYRGLGATLARDIPFSALYWFGIETAKEYLSPRVNIQDAQQRQVAVALLSGVIAGTFATVATHPFDVIKTRTQVTIYSSEAGSAPPQSSLQMLRQVWRQEGLAGLSAGLVPRVAKVAPACAIMIGTYEAAKLAFDQHAQRQQLEDHATLS
ncbi:hypothetical protein Gpo141_00002812 [Globisporangium polare]